MITERRKTMKARMKFVVIIGLLMVIVFLLGGNFVMRLNAQAAPTVQGFWFFRKPQMSQATKDANRQAVERYIERLEQLVTVPVGAIDMTNMVGDQLTWDQAMLDALNTELAEQQQLLADLPE